MKPQKKNELEIVKIAAIAAIFPVLLSYIQISDPFLINPEILKFVAFSVSLFIPVIFEILITKTGIALSEEAFLAMSYVIYAAMFYGVLHFYYKSKNKSAFVKKLLVVLGIYVILVVFLMW